jgi:hypothetical protein
MTRRDECGLKRSTSFLHGLRRFILARASAAPHPRRVGDHLALGSDTRPYSETHPPPPNPDPRCSGAGRSFDRGECAGDRPRASRRPCTSGDRPRECPPALGGVLRAGERPRCGGVPPTVDVSAGTLPPCRCRCAASLAASSRWFCPASRPTPTSKSARAGALTASAGRLSVHPSSASSKPGSSSSPLYRYPPTFIMALSRAFACSEGLTLDARCSTLSLDARLLTLDTLTSITDSRVEALGFRV